METFTLIFFVLMIFVAALLVTQTIRRELKARERTESTMRRVSLHMRPHSARSALPSPPYNTTRTKSPPRHL
jgi:hypothetical protein